MDTWVYSLGIREVYREDDFFFELRTIEQIAQRIEEYNKEEVVDEITVEGKEIRKLVELPLVYQKRSYVVNVFALVRGYDGEFSREDVPKLDNEYVRRLLRRAKDVKFM